MSFAKNKTFSNLKRLLRELFIKLRNITARISYRVEMRIFDPLAEPALTLIAAALENSVIDHSLTIRRSPDASIHARTASLFGSRINAGTSALVSL